MCELIKRRGRKFATNLKLVLIVQLVLIVSLVYGQKWRSDQLLINSKPVTYDEQPSSHDEYPRSGERVDKLVSAIGDQIWQERQQQQQRDWFQQNLLDNDEFRMMNGYQYQPFVSFRGQYDRRLLSSPVGPSIIGPQGAGRNYHALVDEFRQSWPSSNPARENRAFRPKLMSTARGFGKRSSGHQVTYPDLLSMATPSAQTASNGKLGGGTVRLLQLCLHNNMIYNSSMKIFMGCYKSPKYFEWISQAVSRWPEMSKYLNEKYVDTNGNVDTIVVSNE